jgi:SpoVK/Ycf46/Vps4 family AAA+-type ATPase/intein/homing endonuclease
MNATDGAIQLKVAEAFQDDVNKGIVRIDSAYMQKAGIRPGDIVEIQGTRKSVAIVDRAYPSDIGQDIIRMDGLIRRNAGTSIGELVAVQKADIAQAKKVTIAPAKKGLVVRAAPEIFKHGLLGRAVVKGDIVSLGGSRRRRTTLSSSPFEEIFRMLDEDMTGFGFGDLKFIIADTNPKQPVIITSETEIVFNPEAVEVSDEEKPFDISYEDVGGLAEPIRKIREMVELPLKHPEIFEALGIEPPKGILLYGPPGTGKTLLAKAVANETSSHFIVINGPEIMSKYYGQSLPYDEPVLVLSDGRYERIPIGRIVEENMEGLQTVAFDKDGTVSIQPITGLIRHERKNPLVRITTRTGRSITVTDDHSLFTLTPEGIADVKTSDLTHGSFIATPAQIPFSPNPIRHLDLLKNGLRVRGASRFIRNAERVLGQQRTAELLGVTERYLSDVIGKDISVPVEGLNALADSTGLELDVHLLQVTTKGKSLPARMPVTSELAEFFGLWIAEGSYVKSGVRLSVHRDEESYVADLCMRLFGQNTIYRKPSAQSSDIIISSAALRHVMEDVLGFISGSREKRIPSWVFSLSRAHLAAFLRGYVSGDGSINSATPAPTVELDTESPALAEDLVHLLLMFGIVPKTYARPNRPQKRICFSDVLNFERFLEIGFIDDERNRAIRTYLASTDGRSRRDRIPMTGLPDGIRTSRKLRAWSEQKSIGKEALKARFADAVPAFSGIYWDEVMSIERLDDAPRYVYDVSVDPGQNFVAGGGIFAHNSEQNLRKKFEEAEQNAPAIIFIDEIDAIASKREEAQGEVEKRVVAQMLAIMDGLKSRGKVVVIAATNMQNQLDPALRRPGRFDREIEIGPPSKEGRLSILKIHTRNMPLDLSLESIGVSIDRAHIVGALQKAMLSLDLNRVAREILAASERQSEPETRNALYEGIVDDALPKLADVQIPVALKRQFLLAFAADAYSLAQGRKNAVETVDALVPYMEKLKEAAAVGELVDTSVREYLIESIAAVTHGFVGADLAALTREAALIVIRREMPKVNLPEDQPIPREVLETLKIRYQDFREALNIVRPSAMREVLISVPDTTWADVAALDDAKASLTESVEWPLKYKDRFRDLGIEPPKGILLYGPSGTGKTLLAKAVAHEAEANFISIKGPELLSKWVGESEKAVRQVFDKARQNAPTIIFFDEFDALAPRRGAGSDSNVSERVVNQLLTELDGLEKMNDVVIIAASNRPDMIDPSLLRPGRFDRLIHIRVPDADGRRSILAVHTKTLPLDPALGREAMLDAIAARTEGFTGADIENLVREAGLSAMRRTLEAQKSTEGISRIATSSVTMDDFDKALDTVKPSVTRETIEQYEQIEKTIRESPDARSTSYFG